MMEKEKRGMSHWLIPPLRSIRQPALHARTAPEARNGDHGIAHVVRHEWARVDVG
jgi:hypothetical protein